jgi:hypothetical protein
MVLFLMQIVASFWLRLVHNVYVRTYRTLLSIGAHVEIDTTHTVSLNGCEESGTDLEFKPFKPLKFSVEYVPISRRPMKRGYVATFIYSSDSEGRVSVR